MISDLIPFLIYGLLSAFIILRVGWLFYHHGAYYLYDIFANNKPIANGINKLLLIGYYLLNLGYICVSIIFWPQIDSLYQFIEVLANKIGTICVVLGVIHFINMFWVKALRTRILEINH